jgi:cysteine sulfinate desulfinase/cysteine desulfurase-like protein
MGFDAGRTAGAVRLSLGVSTTAAEIGRAARALGKAWHALRQ